MGLLSGTGLDKSSNVERWFVGSSGSQRLDCEAVGACFQQSALITARSIETDMRDTAQNSPWQMGRIEIFLARGGASYNGTTPGTANTSNEIP